jgi:hypothetical protein
MPKGQPYSCRHCELLGASTTRAHRTNLYRCVLRKLCSPNQLTNATCNVIVSRYDSAISSTSFAFIMMSRVTKNDSVCPSRF